MKKRAVLVLLVTLFVVALLSITRSKKNTEGMFFTEWDVESDGQQKLLLDEAVVVDFNGKVHKYRGEEYKTNWLGYASEIREKGEDRVYDRYSLNHDCGYYLGKNDAKGEYYVSDVVDIGSTYYARRFCRIDQNTHEVIDSIAVNESDEVAILSNYYKDEDSPRFIVDNYVVSFDPIGYERLIVPGWDEFRVISDKLVDGKVILTIKGNYNDRFVVYDIRANELSEVFSLKDLPEKSHYSLRDVSDGFEHALFRYPVYDTQAKRGNSYSCYTLFNLGTFEIQTEFCSTDFGLDDSRRFFLGWIVE